MSPLKGCLQSIEKRPLMWFGHLGSRDEDCRSLALVQAFITGFQHGQGHPDDTFSFRYFTPWVAAHYRVDEPCMDGFSLIRQKVSEDEALAFAEFFRLLPGFVHDVEEIGPEGIGARYKQVMEEIQRRENT